MFSVVEWNYSLVYRVCSGYTRAAHGKVYCRLLVLYIPWRYQYCGIKCSFRYCYKWLCYDCVGNVTCFSVQLPKHSLKFIDRSLFILGRKVFQDLFRYLCQYCVKVQSYLRLHKSWILRRHRSGKLLHTLRKSLKWWRGRDQSYISARLFWVSRVAGHVLVGVIT